jgi:hypothetical protein
MTTNAVAARMPSAAGAAGPAAAAAASASGASSAGGEGALKLSHAYLELYEPSKDGSLDKAGPQMGRIDFQFNPKELSLGKTAS